MCLNSSRALLHCQQNVERHCAWVMHFCTSVACRSGDRCDWMSVAGAGDSRLQDLKSHPFFAGINWDDLREQPAPAFTPPQHTLGMDEVWCQKYPVS